MAVDTQLRRPTRTVTRSRRGLFFALVVLILSSLLLTGGRQAEATTAVLAPLVAPASLTAPVTLAAGVTIAAGAVATGAIIAGCYFYCDDVGRFLVDSVTGSTEEPEPGGGSVASVWVDTPAYDRNGVPPDTDFKIRAYLMPGYGTMRYDHIVTYTCKSNGSGALYTHQQDVGEFYIGGGGVLAVAGSGCIGSAGNNPDGQGVGGRIWKVSSSVVGFGGPYVPHVITWSAYKTDRESQTATSCVNASGGFVQLTAQGGAFLAGGEVTPSMPKCSDALPGGYPASTTVKERAAGDTTPWDSIAPIVSTSVDLSNHPDCANPATPCELRRVAAPAEPSGEKCMWGPYTMPSADCASRPPPATTTPTTGPSPQPSPRPTSRPAPITPTNPWNPEAPDPYAPVPDGGTRLNPDGSTTQTQQNPDGSTVTRTTYPNGETVTTYRPPAGSPNPPTTVRTPPTVPQTPTDTNPGDPDGNNCFANALSFNPIDWVYWPVRCSYEWAFVPPPGTWGKLGELRDAFAQHPPGSLLTGTGQLVQGVASGLQSSGCGLGPNFTPPSWGNDSMRLPGLCNGSGIGIFDVLYHFVTASLYGVLMWRLWGMADSHFGGGSE